MELEPDDTETTPTTTTNLEGGPGQVASGTMSSSATANSAIPSLKHSENSAPDVDMADVFYFDVGRSSKELLNASSNGNQQQRPATASKDEHESLGISQNPGPPGVNKKRKSPGSDTEFVNLEEPLSLQPSKKVRLEHAVSGESGSNAGRVKDKSRLPPEVWHRVFAFCPPKTLGNLLSVNKLFHDYLAPSPASRCDHPKSIPKGEFPLSPLQPNNIWKASRRLFCPNMPAPLRCMSELQMWRLICSTRCEECGRAATCAAAPAISNTEHGPGFDGVSVVWPLGIRVCGPCLLKKTVKVRSPLFVRDHVHIASSRDSQQCGAQLGEPPSWLTQHCRKLTCDCRLPSRLLYFQPCPLL